jgi:hypothetical protein
MKLNKQDKHELKITIYVFIVCALIILESAKLCYMQMKHIEDATLEDRYNHMIMSDNPTLKNTNP